MYIKFDMHVVCYTGLCFGCTYCDVYGIYHNAIIWSTDTSKWVLCPYRTPTLARHVADTPKLCWILKNHKCVSGSW